MKSKLLSFKSSPDVFAVLNKDTSVPHSDHGKEHAQAEVVHEAEVLLDVAGRRVADVEAQGKEAVDERQSLCPAFCVRNVSDVRIASQVETDVSSSHI